MKANKMHYFSDLFDKVLYMFRTFPLSIIRTFRARNKKEGIILIFSYFNSVYILKHERLNLVSHYGIS